MLRPLSHDFLLGFKRFSRFQFASACRWILQFSSWCSLSSSSSSFVPSPIVQIPKAFCIWNESQWMLVKHKRTSKRASEGAPIAHSFSPSHSVERPCIRSSSTRMPSHASYLQIVSRILQMWNFLTLDFNSTYSRNYVIPCAMEMMMYIAIDIEIIWSW